MGGTLVTTLYIVRHGETDSNIRHTCLGHKDIPLNAAGFEQAKELIGKFRDIPIDAVYSSPLSRAVDTAAGVADEKGLKINISRGLIERDFGDWDDMTFEEIEAKYPQEYAEWRENWTGFKIPNGESSDEAQARISAAVDKILLENYGKCVLIVTHLGTARHIISHALGLITEQSWRFTLDNAKTARIVIKGNERILTGLNI